MLEPRLQTHLLCESRFLRPRGRLGPPGHQGELGVRVVGNINKFSCEEMLTVEADAQGEAFVKEADCC